MTIFSPSKKYDYFLYYLQEDDSFLKKMFFISGSFLIFEHGLEFSWINLE